MSPNVIKFPALKLLAPDRSVRAFSYTPTSNNSYLFRYLRVVNEKSNCLETVMKRSKLVIDYTFDFKLLGISSPAKGYKLAWEFNQRLGIQLVKQPDLVVGFKQNEEKNFTYYAFESSLNSLKLFKNKASDAETGKYFLIPEFPHYDFIFLQQMKEHYVDQDQLAGMIKAIPSVQLVASIPVESLKSKSNFIF